MNCQRRRSGPSFEVDAAPTPVPDGPEASPKQPGASRGRARDEPGTSRSEDCGAFRQRAPDECFRRHAPDDPLPPARPGRSASAGTPRTIRTICSPATARRAVVIGLQPAANGRGCGLCV